MIKRWLRKFYNFRCPEWSSGDDPLRCGKLEGHNSIHQGARNGTFYMCWWDNTNGESIDEYFGVGEHDR